MSSNNSTDLEIQRLSSEVHERREAAEFWDIWNIRILSTAGFAALLLVITAIGVSRSNRELLRSSDELDRAKDRKLQSDLKAKDVEIGLAGTNAGTAIHEAALANKRAADANQKTEELRTKNLELEQHLGETKIALEQERTKRLEMEQSERPREIMYVQARGHSNIDPLRQFTGMQFVIEYLPEAEPSRAAGTIDALLRNAGWKRVDVRARPDLNTAIFDGVHVNPYRLGTFGNLGRSPTYTELGWGQAGDASDELIDFLLSNGWVADMGVGPNEDIPPGAVKVTVGLKPNPYFAPDFVKEARKQFAKAREQIKKIRERDKARDEEMRKLYPDLFRKPKP